MLQYTEVTTNLRFINIPTMLLEYCAGIELDSFALFLANEINQAGSYSNDIWSTKVGLQMWRKHTISKIKIFKDLFKRKISINKVSLFSLRLLN